jgi:hypothetical protein
MKRRLQVGAVLVVALAAALNYFTGFPPGLGGGSGEDGGSNSDASDTRVGVSEYPSNDVTTTDDTFASVVRIVVEKDGYSLKQIVEGSVEYQPAELDRIIELARNATGNDAGVRVVLTSRQAARPPAENLLKSKLLEAGLTEREIYGYSNLTIEDGETR